MKFFTFLYIFFSIFHFPLFSEPIRDSAEAEVIIDLNQFPVFIHSGFSTDYTKLLFSPVGKGWLGFSPSGNGNRTLRVIDIPEFSKHRFLSTHLNKPEEFTFIIPFFVSHTQLAAFNHTPESTLGIHLAGIGDNWEIYLNEKNLRQEIHLDPLGNILAHRNYRNVIIPFRSAELRPGSNLLVLRIIGDPANPMVGLNATAPYRIASYSYLRSDVGDIFDVALSMIYIFMGLYIIIINLQNNFDSYNRSYGFFLLILGVYFLVRLSSMYQLIPDSEVLFKIELTCLFLIVPSAVKFLSDLSPVTSRQWIVNYGIYFIYGAFLTTTLIFPPAYGHDMVNVWAFTSVFTILYIYGYLIIWKFLTTVQKNVQKVKKSRLQVAYISAFKETLTQSPIGNALIGITILISTAILDSYNSIVINKNTVLSRYSLMFFTVGSVFVLARRYRDYFLLLNDTNKKLESQIHAINKAKLQAEINEELFSRIFNGTAEPMIITDEQWLVKDFNESARNLFIQAGINLRDKNDENLLLSDFLYNDTFAQNSLTVELNALKNDLRMTNRPLDIDVWLGSDQRSVLFRVLRLERINSDNTPLILARFIFNNRVYNSEWFISGRGVYRIENSLYVADTMSRHISAMLNRYLNHETVHLMMVAIREMLINAIEHGNLAISAEEKAKALAEHNYYEFIQRRKEGQKYKQKRVYIKYLITPRKAFIKIKDEGQGFDHAAILEQAKHPGKEFLKYYQGIFLALAAFDRVVYNESGNQVVLEKILPKKDADHA